MSAARARRLLPSGRAAASALLALGTALVLLAAALLVPRAPGGDERPAVRTVLVDASASVVRRRPSWLPWVRAALADEARAAEEAGEDLLVMLFAEEIRAVHGPAPPDSFLERLAGRGGEPLDPLLARDGATRLAAALAAASDALHARGRRPGPLRLLGPGTWTDADPGPALARLALAGATLSLVPPPPAELPSARLASLRLPPALEVGAPLVLEAEVELAPAAGAPLPEATLAVRVVSAAGTRELAAPVPAAPGATGEPRRVRVALDLGPAAFGRTVAHARVRLAAGGPDAVDPLPEDDALSAATLAEGEIVLGVVAAEDALPLVRAWLAPLGEDGGEVLPGLSAVLAPARETAALLAVVDALVTFDVPLDRLPADLLASFVRRGGGWLALSGYGFLSDWTPGRAEEGLHALLPMRPAASEERPRDVVLLVDGSGSMAGRPFDLVRAAAVEMVAAAPPSDRIELRLFTTGLHRPVLVRARDEADDERSRSEAARRLLAERVPTGRTWILHSLEELAAERERAERDALVLLLSDGREMEWMEDPVGRARAVAERLRAARARLRPIAVGDGADEAFLAHLAAPGEEVVRAGDLGELASIFERELHRARVRESDAGLALVLAPAPEGSLAAEVAGPLGIGPLPPLRRVVRNELRAGAEALAIALGPEPEEADPALAVQRAGLGRTALLASVPRPDWAPAWIGARAPLGALLRWLGRDRPRDGPTAAVTPDGRISVRGLAGAPALVPAVLAAPDGEELARLELAPPLPTPGEDVLRARAAPAPPGALDGREGETLALLLELPAAGGADGGAVRSSALPLAVPRAAEHRGAEHALAAAWLEPAARPPAAPPPAPGAPRAHPAAPGLLGAGLAALAAAGVLGARRPRRAAAGGQALAPVRR